MKLMIIVSHVDSGSLQTHNPPTHQHYPPKTGSRFAVDFGKSTEDNEPVPPLN